MRAAIPLIFSPSLMYRMAAILAIPSLTMPTLAASPPALLQLHNRPVPDSTKVAQDPKALMRRAVSELIRSTPPRQGGAVLTEALVSELLADLPIKWERLGDLVLIPANSLIHAAWPTGETSALLHHWQDVTYALLLYLDTAGQTGKGGHI